MADEDLLPFDPSMKKKKKKKKTGFDLDAAMGEDTGAAATDSQPAPAPEPEEKTEEVVEEKEAATEKIDDFSMDFSFTQKKKKKKKKNIDLGDIGDALPDAEGDGGILADGVDGMEDGGGEDGVDRLDGTGIGGGSAWSGSDRDYTYDELLTRVFDIMREKNPDMVAGEKKKFVMRPPQVLKVGTRKTSFANFADICRLLHRQPKHVLSFLIAELGTSGSVDGNNQLIIRGKYTQKQIENVLRRYIKEYVTCHTCRSRDTLLQKDTRLFFLQCETCGSRCSVTSIKTGFQAVTGKRAAIRAKTS